MGACAQLTPPRQLVSRDVDEVTPVVSRTFFPIESLAAGGLAASWGAGCPPFSDADLEDIPLSRSDLEPHYQAVAERIGVSEARDHLLDFFGDLDTMQPPLEVDDNDVSILDRYAKRRERLNRSGFFLDHPSSHILASLLPWST